MDALDKLALVPSPAAQDARICTLERQLAAVLEVLRGMDPDRLGIALRRAGLA